jgi:hypothetical protein
LEGVVLPLTVVDKCSFNTKINKMKENKDLTQNSDRSNEKLHLSIVTHSNLRLGAKVVDSEQNTGVITSIEDKHNVEVHFDNGGVGLWCFVEDCDEYIKDSKDVLYYCE